MIKRNELNEISFGKWLQLWFETYKKPYLSPYSLRNIEQVIRIHTPQWLKDMKISDITIFEIDKALSALPVGRTYVYTRQVWHSVFLKAQKLGIVQSNVMLLTDKISYKKKKSNALTIAEQTNFIRALEGRKAKWVMLFYLHTGVRRSEALSICWTDIDFEQNLILIKGTKTESSFRHILLTDEVRKILNGQRKQNEKLGYKGAFIFPFSAQQMSRTFRELCPNHHLHDLRHTFITRCAECGVNVSVCQQLVGHSTSDMTMNVYTHVMDEFKRKEALKFTIYPKF